MSAVVRTWLRLHSARAALLGLAGVGGLAWALSLGVLDDRLVNPLGDSYASIGVTLVLPVLATALIMIAAHDRLDPAMALPARPLGLVRAGWWLAALAAVAGCLAPVRPLVGSAQWRIDIALLAGLSTLALCTWGLGAALALPLMVLLPHLARRTGAPARWWTVLATSDLSMTGDVAVALAAAGLVAYATRGPRNTGADH